MSDYGRVWEEIANVRVMLKHYREVRKADIYAVVDEKHLFDPLPNDGRGIAISAPLVNCNTLAEAKRSVAVLKAQLDSFIVRWENLEEKAKSCE